MFFLDSSDHKEIADIFAWGVVAGVTTNPLILAREGGAGDLEQRIRAVVAASTGHVSVELVSETGSGTTVRCILPLVRAQSRSRGASLFRV